mgnify:CR=1 FL=1|tara:strand:+ start:2232 stop:2402 length:171 start_codon:yes stop_codon:yes gene_type:complete
MDEEDEKADKDARTQGRKDAKTQRRKDARTAKATPKKKYVTTLSLKRCGVVQTRCA